MDSNIAIEARHASKIYELRSKEKKRCQVLCPQGFKL